MSNQNQEVTSPQERRRNMLKEGICCTVAGLLIIGAISKEVYTIHRGRADERAELYHAYSTLAPRFDTDYSGELDSFELDQLILTGRKANRLIDEQRKAEGLRPSLSDSEKQHLYIENPASGNSTRLTKVVLEHMLETVPERPANYNAMNSWKN